MPDPNSPREFVTTRWSLILRSGAGDEAQAAAAMDQLCRAYWYPVYACVRRMGQGPEDASDLTQAFFARILERNFTRDVAPEGGRFRSFLIASLKRFVIDEWRKGTAAKRGGGVETTSLDALIAAQGEPVYAAEPGRPETPDELYQRAWAEALLSRVLGRLRDECAADGEDWFARLEPFLTLGAEPPGLAESARDLGLSLAALKSRLHRLRSRYRQLLCDEVAQTLGPDGDVDEEIRSLAASLRRGG